MNIEWEIEKTHAKGGGWVLRRQVVREVIEGNPDEPTTLKTKRVVDGTKTLAFTTLANARQSITDELQMDKRVRLTRRATDRYTYGYPNMA